MFFKSTKIFSESRAKIGVGNIVIPDLKNKYVIIVNGEVVEKGEDIENMLDRVRQEYPDEIPFVAKVPDERMLIL